LHVRVYPNPFTENISIQFEEETNEDITITLMDILGRVVFAKTFSSTSVVDINPGELSSGQFIMRISTLRKQHIAKLIKA
jgi:hypothetical protein